MSQGLSIEICLGFEPLPSKNVYEVNGRSFSSIAEVAEAYNLRPGQLTHRLRLMTIEEAIVYVPSNGRYSEARFQEEPELANSMGILYFAKIDSSGGELYKIGITIQSVASRFKSTNYTLIAEYSGRMVDLFQVEQAMLNEFRDNHFRGDDDFDGRTETFLLIDSEELEMRDAIKEKMEAISAR